MQNNKLEGALQENILTLLVFNEEVIDIVINNVTVDLFSGAPYRAIAEQAINYYREFKKPIGEHLSDTLEHILTGSDVDKATLYKTILINLFKSKDSVNQEYVVQTLTSFLRQQNLIKVIKKAADLTLNGHLEDAEAEITSFNSNVELEAFDTGVNFEDLSTLKFFNKEKVVQEFSSGVEMLDKLGAYPGRKKLYTLMGYTKQGKSWFCVQLGKEAALRGQKVLHVTLEMSEEEVEERYLMAFLAMSQEDVIMQLPFFKRDEDGNCIGVDDRTITSKISIDQKDINDVVTKKLKAIGGLPLRVKAFPQASLTIPKLKGFIETLIYNNFTPDIIIIDSPDLMDISPKNFRMELMAINKQLKGISQEYNLAMVVLYQTNKEGKHKIWIDEGSAAEDFSIAKISDILVTLNRSKWEIQKNLARLLIALQRGKSSKVDKVMIVQNYDLGQFCTDSIIMNKDLREMVSDGNKDLKLENET
jgi:replicative DNA helicase